MKENCLEIYEHKGQRYFTQHQSIYTTNSHAKSDETKLRDIRKMLCKKKQKNYHARQVKNQYHNCQRHGKRIQRNKKMY